MRKCVQVELITDVGILHKRVAKPNFSRGNPITDCQGTVATLTLNQQSDMGFSVLNLSKLYMYNFHMCVKYPSHGQLRLLFTDTDSLAYAVQTEDIYRDMAEDAVTHYDFSEYPLDHPFYAMNHRALGFFKDELNSVPMQDFVGLHPKHYAFICMGKVSNNLFQNTNPCGEEDSKVCQMLGEGCSPAVCTLFGCTLQLSYISLLTEPDQVYPTNCVQSSHVQGRLDSI